MRWWRKEKIHTHEQLMAPLCGSQRCLLPSLEMKMTHWEAASVAQSLNPDAEGSTHMGLKSCEFIWSLDIALASSPELPCCLPRHKSNLIGNAYDVGHSPGTFQLVAASCILGGFYKKTESLVKLDAHIFFFYQLPPSSLRPSHGPHVSHLNLF